MVAYSLSLEPLKAHETDLISQLPVSGDPGGARAATTAPSHVTGLMETRASLLTFRSGEFPFSCID